MAYRPSSLVAVKLALCVILSDILSLSDILYEKPAPCAKMGLLETTIEWNGDMMAKLSETELKMLVKGGETNTVELKLAAPRAVDLAERFCGMANASGGIVIIGVDSTHKVVGVPDERIGETMDVILRAARQVIKPELLLDPSEPEVYLLAGKKLLIASIPPTDGPIYQAGGIFWILQGTQTRALSMAELSEMIYDRGLRDWELEAAFNATMEDIDMEKVQSFIARRLSSDRQSGRFKDRERVLIGMRCAIKVSGGTIVPTNAGMLFFGHNPQDHIPQSEVVCVLFRESVGASRYADRKIVAGTLQDIIDNTEAFLGRYIAVGVRPADQEVARSPPDPGARTSGVHARCPAHSAGCLSENTWNDGDCHAAGTRAGAADGGTDATGHIKDA
jgi:predicted HTH transcriptional regulator